MDSGYDSLDFTYPLESDLTSDCAIQRLNRRGLIVENSDGHNSHLTMVWPVLKQVRTATYSLVMWETVTKEARLNLNPDINKKKKLDLLFILQYKVKTKGETIVFYI